MAEKTPEERLREIEKTLKDAQFGYAVPNAQTYYRDVLFLNEQRKGLLGQIAELESQVEELNATIQELTASPPPVEPGPPTDIEGYVLGEQGERVQVFGYPVKMVEMITPIVERCHTILLNPKGKEDQCGREKDHEGPHQLIGD